MPFITTRADSDLKQRFQKHAAAKGLKESELLQRLILAELGVAAPTSAPAPETPEDTALDRMTFRLPGFLMQTVKERAMAKGMAPSRWVASLVQSNLRREPVMADSELAALNESNRELAAVGRNINQIAKALNEAFHESDRVKLETLGVLAEAIKQTRAAIRALVRASQQAWNAEP